MRVRWTSHALQQLTGIYEHIACDSIAYAQGMIDRLTSRSRQIGEYPHSGEMVPEYQAEVIREVIEGPYRIVYRVTDGEVHVLAVIHTARQFPTNLDGGS